VLDSYVEKQHLAYNILMNEIINNHISHAYLIDENDNLEAFGMVMAFVKEILCISLTNNDEKEILCKRIDDGNYPEVKIIEPNGLLIKKGQILDLQQEFSKSSVEGNKRIYIIRDADKMRSETANSMLKFLEEPDNNIVAILMTNNYNNLLPTIISRCQVIRLEKDNNDKVIDDIDEIAINFIYNLEKNGIRTILNTQELIFNIILPKERDKFVNLFDKMIDMYYDIVKISIDGLNIKYNEYFDKLIFVAKKNSVKKILNKINNLVQIKDSVKYNVNCNLLIDSLIIELGGTYENSRS